MATGLASNSQKETFAISLMIDFQNNIKIFVPIEQKKRFLTLQTDQREIVYALKSDQGKQLTKSFFPHSSTTEEKTKVTLSTRFTAVTASTKREKFSDSKKIDSICCKLSETYSISFARPSGTHSIILTNEGKTNTYFIKHDETPEELYELHRLLNIDKKNPELTYTRDVTIHSGVKKRPFSLFKATTTRSLPSSLKTPLGKPAASPVSSVSSVSDPAIAGSSINLVAQDVVALITQRVGLQYFDSNKGLTKLPLNEEDRAISNDKQLSSMQKLELIMHNLTKDIKVTRRHQLNWLVDTLTECFEKIDMRAISKKEIVMAVTKSS